MRGAVVLVLLLMLTAAFAPASVATATSKRTVLSGTIVSCAYYPGVSIIDQVTPRGTYINVVRDVHERWRATLSDQPFAGQSTYREVFLEKVDGSIRYHSSGEWFIYPGSDPNLDVKNVPGGYDIHYTVNYDPSVPFAETGFLKGQGLGVGFGTLRGQIVRMDMAFFAWGPDPTATVLCPNPNDGNWYGRFSLEIINRK